jgi:hypothetical protein
MNREKLDLRILVRGSNDVASAVAHRLFREDYSVVLHDDPKPTGEVTCSAAPWAGSKFFGWR